MSEQFANYASTTLAVPAAAGDTTLTVLNSATFPATGTFRIVVDTEIMTVTAVAGNVFTVTRASEVYAGTQVAAAHIAGVAVIHILTAGGLANAPLAIGNSVPSGTAGSVLYLNGSDNLAQDPANFNYATSVLTAPTFHSLVPGTGTNNERFGLSALIANTTGFYNIAIGFDALLANTTGSYNVAAGPLTMTGNTTGSQNFALGYAALRLNSTGSGNVAVGQQALYQSTSDNNVAIGNTALYGVVSGSNNVGIGTSPGGSLATGNSNIFIGSSTGYATTSATDCIYLGRNAGRADLGSTSGLTGVIIIGASAQATGNYAIALGVGAIAAANECAFGPNINVQTGYIFSSTAALRPRADILDSNVSNTDATRTYRRAFRVWDTTAREAFRTEADGTQALVGFYGVPAVARQLLATGAGHTVDDVITALQTLGLLRQS